MTVIVAVDGPAGSGKSSVSREAARRLGFGYVDTGAAYRILTWSCLHTGVDLDDEQKVVAHLLETAYQAPMDPDGQSFVVHGVDVTDIIREEFVSQNVSRVAKHPGVRTALNEGFRALPGATPLPGVIVEGRDITTVVFPNAPVRVLLTADEEVRIARRAKELGGQDVAATLSERDRTDRTVVDFLTAAPGVHVIDSTELSFEETIQALVDRVNSVHGGSGASA